MNKIIILTLILTSFLAACNKTADVSQAESITTTTTTLTTIETELEIDEEDTNETDEKKRI